MAKLVCAGVFGVLVGMTAGAACGTHAQEDEDTAALAEQAGVDPTDLAGASATTGLSPQAYLQSIGLLASPPGSVGAGRRLEASAGLARWTVWDRLAQCESGGRWNVSTGNGYFGGLQFDLQTWRAYGGLGIPSQASRATQITVAERLRAARGYAPWSACSRRLGLR